MITNISFILALSSAHLKKKSISSFLFYVPFHLLYRFTWISILNSSHRPASLLSTQLLRFPDDHSLSSTIINNLFRWFRCVPRRFSFHILFPRSAVLRAHNSSFCARWSGASLFVLLSCRTTLSFLRSLPRTRDFLSSSSSFFFVLLPTSRVFIAGKELTSSQPNPSSFLAVFVCGAP